MIGDLPVIDILEEGLGALKGKVNQLFAYFDEMNKAPTGIPTNRRAAEIFQLEADKTSKASATVTFLMSRYAIGDVTLEQIQKGLRELEFSAEEARSFVAGARKLSNRTLLMLRTKALIIGARRVSPVLQSYRSSIDFKPVSAKGVLRAMVPFVSLSMFFRGKGRRGQSSQVTFELSIEEFLNLRNILSSVYGRLKQETARLSEKMGEIVISPETIEAMFSVTDDVQSNP